MSAQNVLHASENETRELQEGIKENNILPKGQINDFYKVQTEKSVLVFRPGEGTVVSCSVLLLVLRR